VVSGFLSFFSLDDACIIFKFINERAAARIPLDTLARSQLAALINRSCRLMIATNRWRVTVCVCVCCEKRLITFCYTLTRHTGTGESERVRKKEFKARQRKFSRLLIFTNSFRHIVASLSPSLSLLLIRPDQFRKTKHTRPPQRSSSSSSLLLLLLLLFLLLAC
jgi:hypothetical protein